MQTYIHAHLLKLVESHPRVLWSVFEIGVTSFSESLPALKETPGPKVMVIGKVFHYLIHWFALARLNIILENETDGDRKSGVVAGVNNSQFLPGQDRMLVCLCKRC